jgi:rhomboid protease GluP
MGMNNARLVYEGQAWRLIVSLFLHVNASHLVSTMFILLLLAPAYEYTFGTVRIILVYLGTGILASIFSDLLRVDPNR